MKKLYIPADESELVFLKSVFEADDIPYYVLNDNFGSVYPGIYAKGFNSKTIMVPEEYYDEAKDIIKSVIDDPKFEDERKDEKQAGGPGSISDFLSLNWLFKKRGQDGK